MGIYWTQISPTGVVNKTALPAKPTNQLTSNIGDQYVLTINVISFFPQKTNINTGINNQLM